MRKWAFEIARYTVRRFSLAQLFADVSRRQVLQSWTVEHWNAGIGSGFHRHAAEMTPAERTLGQFHGTSVTFISVQAQAADTHNTLAEFRQLSALICCLTVNQLTPAPK